MKQKVTEKGSRRRFLSLGLLGGAGLLTQSLNAMDPEPDDMVKMLTADGKLVEVSKKVLRKSSGGKKSRNEDILKWTDSLYKPEQ